MGKIFFKNDIGSLLSSWCSSFNITFCVLIYSNTILPDFVVNSLVLVCIVVSLMYCLHIEVRQINPEVLSVKSHFSNFMSTIASLLKFLVSNYSKPTLSASWLYRRRKYWRCYNLHKVRTFSKNYNVPKDNIEITKTEVRIDLELCFS